MPQAEWSDEVARTIGRQVRRYRDRAGMSAQRLADALAELGVPMERSVLAGLENGRRRTVSVAELIAFGKVLDVAPLALIYPVEDEAPIEVVPGQLADVVAASKWFAGDTPFPDESEGLTEAQEWVWADDAVALSQLRKHDRYVQYLLTFLAAGRKTFEVIPYSPEARSSYESLARAATEALRKIRDLMRERGITPPPLPPEFAGVDDPAGPQIAPYSNPPTIGEIRDKGLRGDRKAAIAELKDMQQEMEKSLRILEELMGQVGERAFASAWLRRIDSEPDNG